MLICQMSAEAVTDYLEYYCIEVGAPCRGRLNRKDPVAGRAQNRQYGYSLHLAFHLLVSVCLLCCLQLQTCHHGSPTWVNQYAEN
jgi:hypothetical protein